MSTELHKRHKAEYKVQKYISKNLRLLRTINGMSQAKVADALHMSRSYYSSLESGNKFPDFMTLSALSDFYNISLDYLLGFDISEHFLSLLSRKGNNLEAYHFAEKYLKLSYGARHQVRKRMAALLEKERNFNHFPWDYKYENKRDI